MMLKPSLTNLLAEARVETLHQAVRNDGRGRRVSGTASQIDRSPTGAIASHLTRMVAHVFGGGRPARDEAGAIHAVVGHGSTTIWSPRS
jgi:hypothetical protein